MLSWFWQFLGHCGFHWGFFWFPCSSRFLRVRWFPHERIEPWRRWLEWLFLLFRVIGAWANPFVVLRSWTWHGASPTLYFLQSHVDREKKKRLRYFYVRTQLSHRAPTECGDGVMFLAESTCERAIIELCSSTEQNTFIYSTTLKYSIQAFDIFISYSFCKYYRAQRMLQPPSHKPELFSPWVFAERLHHRR